MINNEASLDLSFAIDQVSQHFCCASVVIPRVYIDTLYHEAAIAQKNKASIHGFSRGNAPLEYIKDHYKTNLTEHIKEFLFKYFVISFLYNQIEVHKLYLAGEPRIRDILIEEHQQGIFIFDLSLATPIEFREWKNFSFKAPKRKNYKDIDRQVELFMTEEIELAKNKEDTIQIGDWIYFEVQLTNAQCKPLLGQYTQNIWLKLGNEEADIPYQELFLGKKNLDIFCTSHPCLQEYFSNQLDTYYSFLITIKDILHQHNFSFECFKHHFKLKNNKEIHQKLIEVFSYRNDLSQRRSMVEEALKLLLTKHHVDVPNYLILRQQKLVLESVHNNPDYQVYKTEPSFKDTLRQLAVKQAKEIILIDQLSHRENIKICDPDIKSYLNLIKRPRTKEFIYFNPPSTKIEGQEVPLPGELLKKSCLREKTLNHVIYHLTRK